MHSCIKLQWKGQNICNFDGFLSIQQTKLGPEDSCIFLLMTFGSEEIANSNIPWENIIFQNQIEMEKMRSESKELSALKSKLDLQTNHCTCTGITIVVNISLD